MGTLHYCYEKNETWFHLELNSNGDDDMISDINDKWYDDDTYIDGDGNSAKLKFTSIKCVLRQLKQKLYSGNSNLESFI